jgi:hypothetical protein
MSQSTILQAQAFRLAKGVANGRFRYIIYRQAPGTAFNRPAAEDPLAPPDANPDPVPDPGNGGVPGGNMVCEGVLPGQTVDHFDLLLNLFDYENYDHVDYIRSAKQPPVVLHELDVSLPLYRIQNEIKMLLWSQCQTNVPNRVKRIRKIGIVVYPLMTQDELECILTTVVPLLRSYYCFPRNVSTIEIVIFTITHADASLPPRLALIGQQLTATFRLVGLTGAQCATCPECTTNQTNMLSVFFTESASVDRTTNLVNLVQRLERKLMCMGNIKGLIVSSKMQGIFNRMQYIEEKYRTLQHHLMTDTTYDGMLSDIDHIESKIKEVAVQIPLSYIEGNNLLNKIVTFRGPTGQAPPSHTHHTHHPGSCSIADDRFYIPGRYAS